MPQAPVRAIACIPMLDADDQLPVFDADDQLPVFDADDPSPVFDADDLKPVFDADDQLPVFDAELSDSVRWASLIVGPLSGGPLGQFRGHAGKSIDLLGMGSGEAERPPASMRSRPPLVVTPGREPAESRVCS